jgi:hypothetical protein
MPDVFVVFSPMSHDDDHVDFVHTSIVQASARALRSRSISSISTLIHEVNGLEVRVADALVDKPRAGEHGKNRDPFAPPWDYPG